MKVQIATAALVFAAVPAFSQSAMTGVSNPEPVVITANDDNDATAQKAKPAAGTPAVAPAEAKTEEVYGPYVPYKGATTSNLNTAPAKPVGDVDAQIVLSVPEREGELREGTLLHVRLNDSISTASTSAGAQFTAEVMEPVEKDGRVIIPIGSILDGQVTEARSGRRISGGAALHLEPRSVTLPDGTHYILHAQLIDTNKSSLNVDREGTLKRRDHAKETLAVMSLTTGGAAAAGAVIGGGVGAAVGAGIGAGVSTFMWLKEDRQASVAKDVRLVFSLTTPMILKPMSNGSMSSVVAPKALAGGGQ
jgi:hypothetical protein